MKNLKLYEEYGDSDLNKKVYNMIAQRLGWGNPQGSDIEPFDHMMQNDGEDLDIILKKAINMLCDSYRVDKIFDI